MTFRKQLQQSLVVLSALGMGALIGAPVQASTTATTKDSARPASKGAKTAKPTKTAKAAKTAAVVGGAGVAVAAAGKSAGGVANHDAETRLLAVIQLIERQQLDAAIKAAASLTADVPNFRAAQLVYADLLRFRSGRSASGSAMPAPSALAAASAAASAAIIQVKQTMPAPIPVTASAASQGNVGNVGKEGEVIDWRTQLHGLQDELKRRVQGSAALPSAGSVPREFLMLDAGVRHVMALDASKSRLYLFVNEDGKLRLLDDFYVTVAKLGMGKSSEGDLRTPEGVYFINGQIPGVKLPDFYGKGALTVNYPNEWDKSLGRTGGGIWLHGSPPDQFARLPEASDGCVVLSNPDLLHLMKTVAPKTPILIRDKLQWVTKADQANAKATDSFMRVLESWQQAWKSADRQVIDRLYVTDLTAKAAATTTATPSSSDSSLKDFFRNGDTALRDVSLFAWKEPKGEIRVVNLKVRNKITNRDLPIRQYWLNSGDRWKIISEEVAS